MLPYVRQIAAHWRQLAVSQLQLCESLRSSDAALRFIRFTAFITAEPQRNAEIRREDLQGKPLPADQLAVQLDSGNSDVESKRSSLSSANPLTIGISECFGPNRKY
jgi:hypothetical protein